jgi:hypothetical protein
MAHLLGESVMARLPCLGCAEATEGTPFHATVKTKDEAGAHGQQRLSHGRRCFPIMYRNFFVRSFVPV